MAVRDSAKADPSAPAVQAKTVKQVLAVMRRHPGPLGMGVLMILISTAAALSEPRLFGFLIDQAILPKRFDRLNQLVLIYFCFILVRVSTLMAQSYFFISLGQRVAQELRFRVFSHLQRIPIPTFDKHPAGSLMTRVTNDVASFAEMFSAGFVTMVSNACLVIGILVGLVILDLKLGLIAIAVFPFLFGVAVFFSRQLQKNYRQARNRLSAVNAFLAENLMGMKVIQLFNRQPHQIDKFERLNQHYMDALVNTVRTFSFFHPSITFLSGIAMTLMIAFGTHDVLDGRIPLGVLVAFYSYVFSLFQPIRDIADKWNIFLSGMAAAERIFSTLDWPVELEARQAASPVSRADRASIRGHIVFENVWFAYVDEHWVLKDFSCEFRSGEKVGIVGHTGSGKTTLMSLLLRFYEIQRGRILLDGKDLREYDRRELRSYFGIVQQDVFLFSGTVEENLSFWSSGAVPDTTASVRRREILDLLGYAHWLDGGKEGSLQLEERAVNLSMGERQVLSLARVMATEPRIWILDEATANLDTLTEALIQRVLAKFAADRTALMIAHRLATVKDADRILVLNKGVLVEQGSHTELLKQNGLYARIYRVQSAESSGLIQTV